MKHIKARLLSLTLALSCGLALAPAPVLKPAMAANTVTLKVGDTAPNLAIATWWQNKNLPEFQQNRVYLVDFWASGDAPSAQSFSQLAQLKAAYASEGVEVVAVGMDENADDAANFLEQQGGQFDFFVGLDRKGISWNAWGRAAGKGNTPASFLVDAQGRIVWIGHLMDENLQPAILKETIKIPFDALPITPKA